MSATLNATGTKQYHAAATSFDYTGMTVASGSNSALVVVICFGSVVSAVSATWDNGGTNQAMTQVILSTDGSAHSAAIFGLVAPTAGNKTLHIAWTGSSEIFVDAVAYDSVDQTGSTTTFYGSVKSVSVVATVTVSSTTGDFVVACQCSGAGQGTATGTLLFDDHVSGSVINAMAEYDAGAASVAIGSSLANNLPIVATGVKAAAGGGGVVVPFNLFQHSA